MLQQKLSWMTFLEELLFATPLLTDSRHFVDGRNGFIAALRVRVLSFGCESSYPLDEDVMMSELMFAGIRSCRLELAYVAFPEADASQCCVLTLKWCIFFVS